ncbi:glyoxal oxidase precursor [Seiridium cupressi]
MRFKTVLAALGACILELTSGQQYAGDFINSSLPTVPGSEIAYFRINDPSGSNNNLTLVNYYSHGTSNQRLVESNVQRAVVIVHGLNRDPGTYMSNMLSALAQVESDPNINFDTVAIMAPYFPNGDDKNYGYPWTDGLKAGRGSTSNCLVWPSSQWSAGGNNQYPYTSKNTSSYTVLDQIVQYFDNTALFPNMKQIVIAGHSMGAQTVQRHAAIGPQLGTKSPVSYWIGNPNSYAWLSTDRPFSTASCPTYDVYREGFTNFTAYPMTYGTGLVAQGRSAILANHNSKAVNYARGTLDLGDDSSTCAPFTTGSTRNERFFNFIKAFPPSCPDPTGPNCDTVDFVNSGHDAGAMMASAAGQARLFIDNFYGNGNRSYDFGYPRQQAGDDPYPNPALDGTLPAVNNNTYAGNMTYWGCWADQSPQTLTNMTYQNSANTIELCTQTCAAGGNTIAGLEFGTQCYCGQSLGYLSQQVVESSCSSACPGNSSEICGGSNRLSIFSNGRPTQLPTPGTPETVGGFYYTSCYTEATSGRALAGKATSSNAMSLEYCASFCASYQYFGTEYGAECYCGNSFGTGANRMSDSDCNMLCANDASEFCGAGSRLTVYQNTSWVAPTPSSDVSCPTSNNTIVTSNSKNFTIECGIDHSGGDLSSLTVTSFQGCIDACAQNSQCVDISLSGTSCYLKSSLGTAVSNGNVWGAKLTSKSSSSTTSSAIVSTMGASSGSGSSALSSATGISSSTSGSATSTTTSSASASSTPLSCPRSNSTTYVSSGLSFLIECGVDHAGGDLTSTSASSFEACIDACAHNPQCVEVSMSGSACYLKSTLGAPVSNGVWGAKLVSSATTGSTLSGSSTSASTSTPTNPSTSSSSSIVSPSNAVASTLTTSSASASSTSVICPGSNSTTYVSGGLSFIIECGIDHAGGDLKSSSASNLQQCIDACAAQAGCVDVSFLGAACYMKSSLGAPVYNAVNGARLIVSPAS